MANILHCLIMTLAHPSKILLIALFVLALVTPASQASECECQCDGYFNMIESNVGDSGKWPAKLDRCAGACAIAWSQCEIGRDKQERLAAAESEDSESDADFPEQDDEENNALSH